MPCDVYLQCYQFNRQHLRQVLDVVMTDCSEAQGKSTDQKQKFDLLWEKVTKGKSNISWCSGGFSVLYGNEQLSPNRVLAFPTMSTDGQA